MVLSQKINQLEKEYYKNLNIISQALGDQDFIFENIDSDINDDVLAVRDLYLDSEIENNEKATKLAEYAEKGIYVACYYLFLLNEVLKNNEDFDLKKYLILGYKNKNPITTFLYGIYILDIYSTNKKDTDLLKAEQVLNEAYNLGVSIALLPIKNLEISNKLLGLKSEIGEKQPVKKQININEEKRDVYLFTGTVVDRKIISSHNTTTSGGGSNGYGGVTPISTRTTTSIHSTITVVDDYGNEVNYYHPNDIDIRPNNKVTIISLDNSKNNIGIHNKDNTYAYYNSKKLEKLTPNWFNKLPLIGGIISFLVFFDYWGWEYLYSSTGLLIAAGGAFIGLIVAIIIEGIRLPFNKSAVKKLKNDMWKIL